jgi:hypothetical protein
MMVVGGVMVAPVRRAPQDEYQRRDAGDRRPEVSPARPAQPDEPMAPGRVSNRDDDTIVMGYSPLIGEYRSGGGGRRGVCSPGARTCPA